MHRDGDAPASEVEAIRGIEGLTIVSETRKLLLVTGPETLAAMKTATKGLKAWSVYVETFYHTQS